MAAERFLVNLTHGPEDPDRVTIAMVMANSGAALGKQTVVLLASEGVRVGVKETIDAIAEPGFATLRELTDQFFEAGGEIWACTPCVAKRKLNDRIMPEVKLVGAVAAIEFASDNGVSFSF